MNDTEIQAAPQPERATTSPSVEVRPSKASPWANVLILFAVLIIAGVSVLFAFTWLAKKGIDVGKETVIGIAEAFMPETITQTFVAWHEMEPKGTDGNILEVATAEAVETFTRKTNLVLFDKVMPLGTTISEINVPATYRFHIDLNDDWFLTTDGDRVMVIAPAIKPSLPVAFDTARMQKRTQSGWARWDGDESLSVLERNLTANLGDRAQAPGSISKVREASRLAVAKFVKNWLIAREHWSDRTFREIAVVFEDEITGDGNVTLSDQPATLRIEDAGDSTASAQVLLP